MQTNLMIKNEIKFILNQELVTINNIDPNITVLNYLRDLKING